MLNVLLHYAAATTGPTAARITFLPLQLLRKGADIFTSASVRQQVGKETSIKRHLLSITFSNRYAAYNLANEKNSCKLTFSNWLGIAFAPRRATALALAEKQGKDNTAAFLLPSTHSAIAVDQMAEQSIIKTVKDWVNNKGWFNKK